MAWASLLALGAPGGGVGGTPGLPPAVFHAAMRVERRGEVVRFRSERVDRPPASLDVEWRLGPARPSPQLGTLEGFLIERYVPYSGSAERLLRARIHHRPWPLREASVLQLASTLLDGNGLPAPSMPVIAHAQAEPLDVEVWPPTRVCSAD